MWEFIGANLPTLICLLGGLALIVLEVFMPGFGLPGIAGIVLHVIAVVLTWQSYGATAALWLTVALVAVIALAIVLSLRSAAKGRLSKSPMVLSDTESSEAGYRTSADMQAFLGQEGVAVTVLRPSGMAEFSGVKLNVVSEGEYIQAGTRVQVARVEGSRILVHTKVEA